MANAEKALNLIKSNKMMAILIQGVWIKYLFTLLQGIWIKSFRIYRSFVNIRIVCVNQINRIVFPINH